MTLIWCCGRGLVPVMALAQRAGLGDLAGQHVRIARRPVAGDAAAGPRCPAPNRPAVASCHDFGRARAWAIHPEPAGRGQHGLRSERADFRALNQALEERVERGHP